MREQENRFAFFVGAAASIISIFAFTTGIENVQELLSRMSRPDVTQDDKLPSPPGGTQKASASRTQKNPAWSQNTKVDQSGGKDVDDKNQKGTSTELVSPTRTAGSPLDKVLLDKSTDLLWTLEAIGYKLNQREAEKACEEFTLRGFADWRLPAIEELEGIYDPEVENSPRILGGFLMGELAVVWSSSRFDSDDHWTFDFGRGRRVRHSANYNFYDIRALCVHSARGAIDVPLHIYSLKARAEYLALNPPRFVDPERPDRAGLYTQDPGPLVLDRKTGLFWMRRDSGGPLQWKEAVAYCQNISLGGFSDWRLASIADLKSLYNPDDEGISVESGIQVYGSRPWSSDESRECALAYDSPLREFPCVYRFYFPKGSVFSSVAWLHRDQFDRAICVRGPDF